MEGKFIAFETETFYKMIDEVVLRVSEKLKTTEEQKPWLKAEEAKKELGIKSDGKLQGLVKHKHIVASQHGRIKMYSRKSILEFLDKGII